MMADRGCVKGGTWEFPINMKSMLGGDLWKKIVCVHMQTQGFLS